MDERAVCDVDVELRAGPLQRHLSVNHPVLIFQQGAGY